MPKPCVLANPAGKASLQIVWTEPLPQWAQLPPECQRELVVILVGMLVKRLPIQRLAGKGEADE